MPGQLRVGRARGGGLVRAPRERDDLAVAVDRVQRLVDLTAAVGAEELDGDGLFGLAGEVLVRAGRVEPADVDPLVLAAEFDAAGEVRELDAVDADEVLQCDPLGHRVLLIGMW